MAAPGEEGHNQVPQFKLPEWMLEAAQSAATQSGDQEALRERLQQAKREEGTANGDAHLEGLAKHMSELKAQYNLNPFAEAEQKQREEELRESERAISEPRLFAKVIKKPKNGDREQQTQRRDERRNKKEVARTERLASRPKKTTSAMKSRPMSPTFAESSSAGTRTEAATSESVSTSPTSSPTDVDSTRSLFVPDLQRQDRYPVRHQLPPWLTSISINDFAMKELNKKRPQALVSLDALKDCIRRCSETTKPSQLNVLHEDLRNHIHKAEILLPITKHIVRKSNILTPNNGLPLIFRSESSFPSDIKADAYHLYTRWYRGDFSQDILRGILISTSKDKDRSADRLDPVHRFKYPNSAKYYGEGDLVLGQWWPTQLATVRDGAHGAAQAGIFGEREKGAYSIVLAGGGGYHDIDSGDVIEYSGTEGKSYTPSENTQHLLTSEKLGNPIRVLRSAQLPKGNKYRPETGYRYDGVYVVKTSWVVDREKAMYRFKLEREKGQEEIRWRGASRRPTVFEVEEYEKLKGRGRFA